MRPLETPRFAGRPTWLLARLVAPLALLACASGCYSSVSYPASGSTTSTDEVWYVKQKYVLFVRVEHDVFYCPPGQAISKKVCKKAVMHED